MVFCKGYYYYIPINLTISHKCYNILIDGIIFRKPRKMILTIIDTLFEKGMRMKMKKRNMKSHPIYKKKILMRC